MQKSGQKNSRQAQALKMKFFVSNLKQLDDKLSDWNEHVWMLLVDSATVHRDRSITLKFQDGKEI
jgi:3-methyladenine DNA glycosylase/8-oxoguanine DNA glycosylase